MIVVICESHKRSMGDMEAQWVTYLHGAHALTTDGCSTDRGPRSCYKNRRSQKHCDSRQDWRCEIQRSTEGGWLIVESSKRLSFTLKLKARVPSSFVLQQGFDPSVELCRNCCPGSLKYGLHVESVAEISFPTPH